MKISGFTIIRNAIINDYPAVEAITSILPVVDEMVVAVGKSDDNTLGLIQGIGSDKIRIVEMVTICHTSSASDATAALRLSTRISNLHIIESVP
jgi:hypothetical protein